MGANAFIFTHVLDNNAIPSNVLQSVPSPPLKGIELCHQNLAYPIFNIAVSTKKVSYWYPDLIPLPRFCLITSVPHTYTTEVAVISCLLQHSDLGVRLLFSYSIVTIVTSKREMINCVTIIVTHYENVLKHFHLSRLSSLLIMRQ